VEMVEIIEKQRANLVSHRGKKGGFFVENSGKKMVEMVEKIFFIML
jgi:hypothetical protein